MKKFSSKSQVIGEVGETVVCKYMEKSGFSIIERNYTKKWGEIDIIAKKSNILHFVEVKSVTCENFDTLLKNISHVTDKFRPEDQMHHWKQKRLMRTVETYLMEHEVGEWQFDLACVYLNQKDRLARVKIIENIILS